MTIAIAVQVHDGVVLASDSASTITIPGQNGAADEIVNVYNNANKIFNLVKGLPIGAATYGMGSIGASSISTLAKDLRRRFSGEDKGFLNWTLDRDKYTVEEVAIQARAFLFDEQYAALGLPAGSGGRFGFIIAGYSASAQLSEVWLVEIVAGSSPAPKLILAQGVSSVYAAGDPELVSRVVNGYSLKLPEALEKIGLDKAKVPDAMKIIGQELATILVEQPMPVQDAIDFAEFLVSTTSQFTRFKRGAATVGGPVEAAAITKHEQFKWVMRKHYFDDTYNPRGVV